MAAYLSPVFGAGAQLFTNQGIVLSGGKIWTYQAGTTTPYTTWTDSTQLVANANPIILDSAGRPSNEMWLAATVNYKLILMDSNDNILGTWDNIAGLNDITTSLTTTEWSATNLTPSYISSTSFSVTGNNTATFTANRRVKITVSAGTAYGYVYSSSYGGGVTTVVIQPDSTVLDSGISSVSVGLLDAAYPSVPQQYLAGNSPVTVPSASTTPIGAATSINVIVSGVVTITAFDTVLAGILRFVKFSDALTLTHNGTSLILPAGVDIVTAAGDEAIFRSLGSGNWECISYTLGKFTLNPIIGDQFSITATQGSGALTCGLDPCIIRFRSATLTNGQPNIRYVPTALTLVVPSGATLGCTSGQSARLILVAIDNAGTIEEAIINVSSGYSVDESALISTTAISAGSTSTNVYYSTSARSNVPFRVIGIVTAVNTAGAWASPTLVQGFGGNIIANAGRGQFMFTASGTWTVPPNITTFTILDAFGAGGGGAAGFNGTTGAGGGGSGQKLAVPIVVSTAPGTVYTATLGDGGAGAPNTGTGGTGSTGGTTALSGTGLTFPTLSGGLGGSNPSGGVSGGGHAYMNGETGASGGKGGSGGGPGGGAGATTGTGASATTNSGGGGGGGSAASGAYGGGGNGAKGFILIVY